MVMSFVLLLLGLTAIIMSSNYLVEGASSVARRLNVSEFVIGMTIIGFGTSCPELVVSTIGALGQNADIAIGNIIGSNIFNTALILGITAVIVGCIPITDHNKKVDIPFTFLVSCLLITLGMSNNGLSRTDATVFLVCFALYMWYSFRYGKEKELEGGENAESEVMVLPLKKSLIYTIGGLVGIILGGKFFVDGAVQVAKGFGISDKFIAITVLAGGTSLPELVTCITAAVKKKNQMALGDILGSNIFNILLILGTSTMIYPLSFSNINNYDIAMLIGTMGVIVLSSFFNDPKIGKISGGALLIMYALYFQYLIYTL